MNKLQEWPEPIVRVQSLSDSGGPLIPERYVKPVLERPSVSFSAANDVDIPIIDLAGLYGDDHALRATILDQISIACREWGFFQVINHGVSPRLMDHAREVWREFFLSPMEVKQAYANTPKTYEGYGSRAVLDEYGKQLVELCGRLMKVLSINLGLGEEQLQNAFGGDNIGACMRVNFYPKCPQPGLTLGLSSHSDPGGMTLLLPDSHVPGLQVRRDENWITVKPVPHAFIVNIGDQIQVLSNATFKSVEHRVMVNSSKERLSLAFFYNPKSDIPIEPLKELVAPDRPPLYPAMTFDEYRLFIRMRGPCGKSQVESLKSPR
ncbi:LEUCOANTHOCYANIDIN DIOXYGENASE-LIKE PROTEIN [Salix koriyanagi]|uniref:LEUCOANTHOCYANIDIN DIOXYGENASE-LIKE PROTEIN n=1 Tax=Salix koriyanagi TaxID=2511006 RepID=A0A9Q0WU81_9ROSI|nr:LEUCOANTHOCYANIDIN DIOXYGENASE-LIKE PROTEIN [Salix koriyanagi]